MSCRSTASPCCYGSKLMKSLLILTIAVGLAAACSQTEQRQAADPKPGVASTPAQRSDPQPPPAAAAPAASATTPQQGAAESAAAAPSAAGPAAASTPAAAPTPEPVAPPAPTFREVTIPAGTSLSVKVLSTLASNTSKVEDPVRGALANAVVVSGGTAVPEGAEISGLVTDVKESGRVKGKASIGFRFNRIVGTRRNASDSDSARDSRGAAEQE